MLLCRHHELGEVGADKFAFLPAEDTGPGGVCGVYRAIELDNAHDIGGKAPHAVSIRRALRNATLQRQIEAAQFRLCGLAFIHVAKNRGHECAESLRHREAVTSR